MARVQSQPGPEKGSALSLSSSRVIWALKVVRHVARPISLHEISHCLLLLLCSLPLLCPLLSRSVHREKYPNLSTVPRFHSACASVSMFTITDNCLFLFPFVFLFLGGYLNTTRASVQTSRPLHLHRSKPQRVHTKSAYARTKSAHLLRCAHTESAASAPDPSSARHHHLVVECGIHGP